MSMFSYAFKHTAQHHRYAGINRTGDAQYEPPLAAEAISFPCRFEYKRREVLDKEGNRVISEARLYTETELKPLDIVLYSGQRWVVKSSAPKCGLSGRIEHWEVSL